MFLRGDGVFLSSHNLLGVVDQKEGEKDGDQSRVHGVDHGVVPGKEDNGQDPKDEENPGSSKQIDSNS